VEDKSVASLLVWEAQTALIHSLAGFGERGRNRKGREKKGKRGGGKEDREGRPLHFSWCAPDADQTLIGGVG